MSRFVVRVFAAALAVAALGAGCNKKQEAAPSPASADPATPASSASATSPAPAGAEVPAAETLLLIHQTADKICLCPDRACAEGVREALNAANQQLAGRPRAKPSPEQAEKMQIQAGRIAECMKKLP